MLQENSSKVCSGLCPKATKPAFSSGLGFFSALTNFVSQHPWGGKSTFCSFFNRRGKRDIKIPVVRQEAALGTPWRGKGGVWGDALGTPPAPAHLTHPNLLSQIYPLKIQSHKALGRQRICLPLTSLGSCFLSLSSLHMALPSLPPLASFKAFIHRSLWRKWALFVPSCRWQLWERKIYIACPTLPWKSLAEICTLVSNLTLQFVTITPGSTSASPLSKQG